MKYAAVTCRRNTEGGYFPYYTVCYSDERRVRLLFIGSL